MILLLRQQRWCGACVGLFCHLINSCLCSNTRKSSATHGGVDEPENEKEKTTARMLRHQHVLKASTRPEVYVICDLKKL